MLHMHVEGQGPALVLLHGWGFDHRIFMPLARQLQNRWRVHIIDLPGFGQSPMLSWEDFSSAFVAQIPEPCVLLGWSLGGLFAQRLILEQPENILGLYAVTTSPYFLASEQWPGIAPPVLERFRQRVQQDSAAVIREFMALQGISSERLIDWQFHNEQDGLAFGLQVLYDWDLRQAMRSLRRPARFIFGKLDAIVQHKLAERMQSDYPQFETRMYPRAAHMPFLSHPELFQQDFEQFINERIFHNRHGYR